MAKEIEYKYLVKDDSYKNMQEGEAHICQGYLCREKDCTVRVRIKDNRGYITVKGLTHGVSRDEFEYEIPLADAQAMLAMCRSAIIDKIRHYVNYEGHLWEIDEFLGRLKGLVVAEIELKAADKEYSLPPFIGENVTGNPAYYNSNLSAISDKL